MTDEIVEEGPSDEEVIATLRGLGMDEAARRLEFYAGLAPNQPRLSDDMFQKGMLLADSMSFEGILFMELTCDDAIALAALMAERALRAKNDAAMPKLILPHGMTH